MIFVEKFGLFYACDIQNVAFAMFLSVTIGSYGVRAGVWRECERLLPRCCHLYRGIDISQSTEDDWRDYSY